MAVNAEAMRLKVGDICRTGGGQKAEIVSQMAPDAAGNAFIGRVNNTSVFYRADGTCQADEQLSIIGPWISDDVVYLPIIRSPSVIGERFMDLTALRKAHPGKWALRLQFVDDEPEVGVEAP